MRGNKDKIFKQISLKKSDKDKKKKNQTILYKKRPPFYWKGSKKRKVSIKTKREKIRKEGRKIAFLKQWIQRHRGSRMKNTGQRKIQ